MDIEQVVPRLGEEALDTLSRPWVADEIRHPSNAERRGRHVLLGLSRQPRLLYRFRFGEGQVVEARGVEVGQVSKEVRRYVPRAFGTAAMSKTQSAKMLCAVWNRPRPGRGPGVCFHER